MTGVANSLILRDDGCCKHTHIVQQRVLQTRAHTHQEATGIANSASSSAASHIIIQDGGHRKQSRIERRRASQTDLYCERRGWASQTEPLYHYHTTSSYRMTGIANSLILRDDGRCKHTHIVQQWVSQTRAHTHQEATGIANSTTLSAASHIIIQDGGHRKQPLIYEILESRRNGM